MTTGRLNVRKRRYSLFSDCNDGYYDRRSTRLCGHKHFQELDNRTRSSSSGKCGYEIKGHSWEDEFLDRCSQKARRHNLAAEGSANRLALEGYKTAKIKDAAGPLEKKKNISSVVWDRYDSEARFAPKNMVASTHMDVRSPPTMDGDINETVNLVSDEGSSKSAVTVNEYFDVLTISPPHLDSSNILLDTEMSMSECEEILGEGVGRGRKSSSAFDKKSPLMGCSSGGNCYVSELEYDFDEDDKFCETGEAVIPEHSGLNMPGCRSVLEFEKLNRIGEGTYGIVFQAKDKRTGEVVALKKVKMGREMDGFPVSSLREINILASLSHSSVVDFKEVVVDDDDGVYMVMEYMEHDIKRLLGDHAYSFSQNEVKGIMLQLLEGVKYLHDNWLIHRDLKTSNLLFNNKGEMKICDFGISRQYGNPLKPYTPLVVTLYYRAPELLLGTKKYSTAIDMWSVGCIMAELLTKDILFKGGGSEVQQLDELFKTLGTPSETIWPGFSNLPGAKPNFVIHPPDKLRKKFRSVSFLAPPLLTELGFDLLSKLLTYDPDKRITAEDALNHDWFCEAPLPKAKEFMPTFPTKLPKTNSNSKSAQRFLQAFPM